MKVLSYQKEKTRVKSIVVITVKSLPFPCNVVHILLPNRVIKLLTTPSTCSMCFPIDEIFFIAAFTKRRKKKHIKVQNKTDDSKKTSTQVAKVTLMAIVAFPIH